MRKTAREGEGRELRTSIANVVRSNFFPFPISQILCANTCRDYKRKSVTYILRAIVSRDYFTVVRSYAREKRGLVRGGFLRAGIHGSIESNSTCVSQTEFLALGERVVCIARRYVSSHVNSSFFCF